MADAKTEALIDQAYALGARAGWKAGIAYADASPTTRFQPPGPRPDIAKECLAKLQNWSDRSRLVRERQQ